MRELEVDDHGGALSAPFENAIVEDGECVRVQCTNSSDFVVGKQTNFNGPVTIINAPLPHFDDSESVIIRDRIWTQTAAHTLETQAEKNSNDLNGFSLTAVNGAAKSPVNSTQCAANFKPLQSPLPDVFRRWKTLVSNSFMGVQIWAWILIGLVIFSCLIAIIVQVSQQQVQDDFGDRDGNDGTKMFIGDQSHLLYAKADWGGLNASSRLSIVQPVPYVVISHTAGVHCYETNTCQKIVREMQKDHMSRSPPFADIAYNFIVGGDGYIYEGRGWGIRSPHEGFVGNKNLDITFIGDFSVYDEPTPTQVDAVQKLLQFGMNYCHIDKNFTLIAHNATTKTLSPGRNVYRIISEWDHFDPDPKSHLDRHLGSPSACKSPVPFYRTLPRQNNTKLN